MSVQLDFSHYPTPLKVPAIAGTLRTRRPWCSMQRHHRDYRHMFTKCPACGSLNVRRSSIRPVETSATPRLRSPYRCRECGERFWVMSRRASYYLALVVGVAAVAGTVAWNVGSVSHAPRQDPEHLASAAESFASTRKLAESSDPVAEYRLAHMYANGDGVEGNKQQALVWLERAAELGNIEAQYEFGNALREGAGIVQDYERAAKWLQLAAEHGNADAQYALGQMYRGGMGLPTDNARAYMWFNLAAAQGVPGAAAQRDLVLRLLLPGEALEAQAEARRLSQIPSKQSGMVR